MSMSLARLAAMPLLLLLALGATAPAAPEAFEPRLDIYQAPDGSQYFALSLSPNVSLPQAHSPDIVILFDTSASQTSFYRDKALDTLDTLLTSLSRADRVHLLAADLEAVQLTPSFVSPGTPELARAVAAIKHRAPMGATDMPQVLRAAADSFDKSSSAPKALIYIGDGMSAANLLSTDEYRDLLASFAKQQIPVTSFAIGPRLDTTLLASLANQTGGMLAVDGESVDSKQAGAFLAASAHGAVVWPEEVTWPKAFSEVYPRQTPPLRGDRDTIVLGKLDGKLPAEIAIAMKAHTGSKSQSLRWTLAAGESNPDYAFLATVVDKAQRDGGLRLTSVGTPGLKETRRLLEEGVENLAKLSHQAIAAGNLEGAERLADEALRRDPLDPTALAVKKQLEKLREKPAEADKARADEKAQADDKVEVRRFSSEQAAPPTADELAALRTALPGEPVSAPAPAADDVNDGEGRLLDDIVRQNRLVTGLIRTEVENELRQARARMTTDPQTVEQSLKLMIERVAQAPELAAEVRAQLRGQLETALREAARVAATKEILDQQAEEARAAAIDRLRITDALARNQERVKQLMDRFDSLMDEGRFRAANDIAAAEVAEIAPNLPIATSANIVAHATGARMADMALRSARAKAVVDTLATVETALIPFPDDQPVVYPDAAAWEELTLRRKKYTYVDLKTVGPAEEKIRAELSEPTSMEFTETPLADAVEYIKDLHGIEIQLDNKALEEAGQGSDTPVTRVLKGISLRSALRLMLGALDLTYIIKDEVLLITTKDVAETELVTKAYPVADLVIPVQSMGMGGGMGGGMMGGGMMGGMGGGMGGMGGGMGGMGGGMGGMGGMGGGMGGMGGGMFSVPEDLKLGPKKAPATKPAAPATSKAAQSTTKAAPKAARPANAAAKGAAATTAPAAKAGAPATTSAKPVAIQVNIPAGGDPEAAWNEYFAKHQDAKPEDVRETVRQLMHARKFADTIALIRAALRHGIPQPWMYEAMALALQASGGSQAEMERALMSAVDFSDNPDDFMYLAQYLARVGLEKRALKVFRQVSMMEPLRPEPYLYALQLSQQLNDVEGKKWASLGILKQAWPKDKQDVVQNASRTAAAAVAQLIAEKRLEEAEKFQAEIDKANVRDCLVKVTWTGDADVDVMVEEPGGAVASFRNPRTTGGGVLIGDSAASDNRAAGQPMTESYVCPEAFNGTYKVLIRRVWGKVTAGKVTVDVYAHHGTPQEQHMSKQIPLGDQDEMVVFEMENGRRQDAVEEHQLAHAAAGQIAVNQAILAQQLNQISNSTGGANGNFGVSRNALFGGVIQQAVGYMPVITVLPTGAGFSVSGVVSADRRYVRISPFPFFSQVGSVTTFNLRTGGGSTTTPNTGGGTGGAGGGF